MFLQFPLLFIISKICRVQGRRINKVQEAAEPPGVGYPTRDPRGNSKATFWAWYAWYLTDPLHMQGSDAVAPGEGPENPFRTINA